MEISNETNTVTITGNIKSINDLQVIISTIDSVIASHKSIIINIKDSISITSSVLGYLNKLILKDGINININIGDDKLFSLLDDLNLTQILKVRKIS